MDSSSYPKWDDNNNKSSSSSLCRSTLTPSQQLLLHAMTTSSNSNHGHHNHYPPKPLQGPRPAPLKVSKDSRKIKKPPAAPAPSHPFAAPPPPPQQYPRPPVIIYTVSPKVIHTIPSDFMSLVQRLTGVNSSPSAAAAAEASCPSPGGVISPAARLATFHKTLESTKPRLSSGDLVDIINGGSGVTTTLDQQSSFMGILSPNPSLLPSVSPNFFTSSSPGQLNSLEFLREMLMSPSTAAAVTSNRNHVDSSFLLSPSILSFTPTTAPSPNYWDLSFNLF